MQNCMQANTAREWMTKNNTMLQTLLKGKHIILGSASPRRRELLGGLGISFSVDTDIDFVEKAPAELSFSEYPEYMANGKSYGFHRELVDDEILITADTMVMCSDEIMGKPADRNDAIRMISKLSNNTHKVLTGVCLRSTEKEISFTASTDVTFAELSLEEIEYYIDKYRPYDKAGSYGVQEWIGYIGIKSINGSFYNVMGLPVHALYKNLKEMVS